MQPQIRIESRARGPIIGVALLACLAVLLPNRMWTIMLAALGGMIGISYWWVRKLSENLSINRDVGLRWVAVGDWLNETFTLTNHTYVPLLWAEIADESNVPGYRPKSVRAAGPNATTRWREQAICERRGRFHLGPWSLRTSDPFGLFELTIAYPEQQEIVIHPPIHTALPVPLPSGYGSGQLRSLRRKRRALQNASTVRDYRPSDPLKHVHWRKTAQTGELMVREFDEDTGGDVWILVDLFAPMQAGTGSNSTEEHAVLLAASLAAQAMVQSRPVGLAVYGSEPQLITPAHGEGQRWRILRALALISAETSHIPLKNALDDLKRVVKRDAALLVISADATGEWLPALYQISQQSVSVQCALFERESFLDETERTGQTIRLAESELQKLGIATTILQAGDLKPAVDTEQRANREFVYTPMGKAIVRERD